MASLLSLPNELLAQIITYLLRLKHQTHECICSDVLPISAASRRLHDITLPIIYGDICINEYSPPSSATAHAGDGRRLPDSIRLLEVPLRNPRIPRLVASIDVVLHVHYSVLDTCRVLFASPAVRPQRISLRGSGIGDAAAASNLAVIGSCIVSDALCMIRERCAPALQDLSLDLTLYPRNRETRHRAILYEMPKFAQLKRLSVGGEVLTGFGFDLLEVGALQVGGFPEGLEELEMVYDTLWTRRGWTLHTVSVVGLGGAMIILVLGDAGKLRRLKRLTLVFNGMSYDDLEYDGEDHDAKEPADFLAEVDKACRARGVEAWVRMGYEDPEEERDIRTVRMADVRWKSRKVQSTSLVLL